MRRNDEWDYMPPHRVSPLAEAGMGVLRLTLLFGSGAVALALAVAPTVDRSTRGHASAGIFADGLDMRTTGSVHGVGERHASRRGGLQPGGDAVCLIRADGSTGGGC